jgi:hypothetical protein
MDVCAGGALYKGQDMGICTSGDSRGRTWASALVGTCMKYKGTCIRGRTRASSLVGICMKYKGQDTGGFAGGDL